MKRKIFYVRQIKRWLAFCGPKGRFRNSIYNKIYKSGQGIENSSEEEIIKKAFSVKKALAVAITINSPGGSPVQSHLIYKLIKEQSKKTKKK